MGLQVKSWAIKGLILAALAIWVAILTLPDNKLHIIFCDVGQGDGVLITLNTQQILVDGGPDDKISNCLGKHMPFYDRKIELVILTHPQADHMNGLLSILEHYRIDKFITEPEANNTAGYKKLLELLKNISVSSVYTGNELKIGNIIMTIISPEKGFVLSHLSDLKVLGATTDGTDLNSFAIVSKLTYGDFDVLLTADADNQVWPDVKNLPQVEVLKVPHHGSKTGMTGEFLDKVKPQLAVISVGAKNRYGHPRQETLDLLSARKIKTLRTDIDGEIEVVSDGKTYWVK